MECMVVDIVDIAVVVAVPAVVAVSEIVDCSIDLEVFVVAGSVLVPSDRVV